MVTKLQCSPRKSELHAVGSLAVAYIISPTTCIFQNAIVCILVIPAAACICRYAGCSSLHAGCSNLHTSVVQQDAACCILHTGVMQDALRRYAAFIRSYAACMQPACLPSVNPALSDNVLINHCTL